MFFLNLLFLESSCPTNRREYSSHFQVTHAFSITSLGQLDTKVQQNLLIFEGMYFRFSCILFLECLCYKIHKVLDQLWENTVHTGLRCWDLGSQAERLGTSSPFSLRKQTTFFFFFLSSWGKIELRLCLLGTVSLELPFFSELCDTKKHFGNKAFCLWCFGGSSSLQGSPPSSVYYLFLS